MLPDEVVVHLVEALAGLGDALLGRVVELGLKYFADHVADGHHAPDAGGGRGRKRRRLEAVAVAHDDGSALLGVSAVLDAGERFRIEDLGRRAAAFVLRDICACWEPVDGAM